MSFLKADGFEAITYAQITRRGGWTIQKASNNVDHAIGAPYANTGGQGLRVVGQPNSISPTVGYMRMPIASVPVVILGVDFRRPSSCSGESNLLYFREGSITHVYVSADETGTLRAYLGSGVLLGASSAGVITEDSFAFLEVELSVANTGGYVELSVNGTVVLMVSAVDTRNGGALGEVDEILFASSSTGFPLTSNVHDFDNVYVLDDTGAAPLNAKLGPIRIDPLRPAANSGAPDFTPSAGSNFENVDDTTPDDDTTYNESSTSGNADDFTLADLPSVSSTIFMVQLRTVAKRSDAGLIDLIPSITSDATQQDGATQALGSSYAEYTDTFPTDPDGDVAWSDAAVNALVAGYRIP